VTRSTGPNDVDVVGGAEPVAATLVLRHLDSAYNLARWLLKNEHDAQDVVQEACLRALRSASSYRGSADPSAERAWLLAIVRNAAFDALRRAKVRDLQELHDDLSPVADSETFDPQAILLRAANAQRVREAIESLPPGIREVVVLREMEGLEYKQIAAVVAVPIGTIMSRLSRGRRRLAQLLSEDDTAPREKAASPAGTQLSE
jgi:RNA polymerase sigma factor (sigma-70 family)